MIDAVEATDEDAAWRLDAGLEFDYDRPAEKPDCRWRERPERERMLTRIAEDAERALRAVAAADGLLDEDPTKDAHRLLRELIGQDFDVSEDGVPRLHRGTRSDRILSVCDTEMRHGRKSARKRFDGFKLHAAATNSDEPLLTAVEVTAANEQDGPQAKGLVEQQPNDRCPERVLGDTAYGTGPVRAELSARGVDVLAPVAEATVKESRLAKRDFPIDLDAGTVACPAGEVVPIRTAPSGRRRASFPRPSCANCPLKGPCLPQGKGRRQVVVAPEEEFLIAARRALDDPATAEHLRRTRPRIERLLGLLAHRYGTRKARYTGAAKARLQALWAAALVNLHPIGRRLAADPA